MLRQATAFINHLLPPVFIWKLAYNINSHIDIKTDTDATVNAKQVLYYQW